MDEERDEERDYEAEYLKLYQEWQALPERERNRRKLKFFKYRGKLLKRGICMLPRSWEGPFQDIPSVEVTEEELDDFERNYVGKP